MKRLRYVRYCVWGGGGWGGGGGEGGGAVLRLIYIFLWTSINNAHDGSCRTASISSWTLSRTQDVSEDLDNEN